jgi:hypothetical protein
MKLLRSASLGTAALFLFFLIHSPPHRVHHFFDDYTARSDTPSDQHSHDPQGTPNPSRLPETTCVVQMVVKDCHINLTAAITGTALSIFLKEFSAPPNLSISAHVFAEAFQIRAPPKA